MKQENNNKKQLKQQNRTVGGKKRVNLYFTPTFLEGLQEVAKDQQIGMSSYIEQNLTSKISRDRKKLNK